MRNESQAAPSAEHPQVTRRRRSSGRRSSLVALGATAAVLAGGGITYAATDGFGTQQVGTEYASGLQVSDNQVIKPLGDRLVTQTGKFMGSTVSPDGHYLAATSADKPVTLQIFDLKAYKQIWTVGKGSPAYPVNQTISDSTLGQEGPTYSPDGKYLWIGQKDAITRFPVNADGTTGAPTSFKLAPVTINGTKASALVGQITYSPDGKTVYAALNGQNTVVALDPTSGSVLKTYNVGIAPRELRFVNGKLYVSDEGGRPAQNGETTIPSYGTNVPADPYLGTSTTGLVSVIDPAGGNVSSIPVGLHPTAMTANGNALFVTNTNSDTVSVIDTTTDQVVQTIDTQPWPESSVGYAPNGVTVTKDGHLLVTLGRANAVAVYRYDGSPKAPVSYIGLLPTDYYPTAVDEANGQIVVTNVRGIDARGPAIATYKGQGTVPVSGHDTHSTTASLTKFTLPSDDQIAADTSTVFAQNGWTQSKGGAAGGGGAEQGGDQGNQDDQGDRGGRGESADKGAHAANRDEGGNGGSQRAVPVPTRIGAPSTIKHVFLIVKENRTYDQVFGDLGKGNGDPSLAQFGVNTIGQTVTPNTRALAQQFGLYDNVYDIGTNSAEGHNWLMQGDNPAYTESSVGAYERSYDTEEDVLGHQRSGFLWTAVESAGNTARNYGEFEYSEGRPAAATWQQYYCAAQSSNPNAVTAPGLVGNYGSQIPSLDKIADRQSPPFDLSIPDIYRYRIWQQDFEKNGPANFNMMWFSSDHTGGPTTPEAGVADGDLAVGKVVDAISHSKYWASSAIFVVEDDSQDGADHVDGHRAPIEVISPWAQHNAVISTYYSQISMVRTIEQILGAAPLNQKVAAATPMYDAFTNKADLTPFNAVPNQVPLTETAGSQAPIPPCNSAQTAAAHRIAVPARARGLARQWTRWLAGQHLTGRHAIPDYANPVQLNRYVWYVTHDWKVVYPGDHRFYAPAQVPGGDTSHSAAG